MSRARLKICGVAHIDDLAACAAAGVDAMMAWIFMGTFAAARVLYSVCYLRGIQPWRTVTFGIGMLATLGMLVHAGILLL